MCNFSVQRNLQKGKRKRKIKIARKKISLQLFAKHAILQNILKNKRLLLD